MIQVYKIDENGFYKRIDEVEELDELCITTPMTIGYVKPKWNGVEWIEGATQQEIYEWNLEHQSKPQEPSELELLKEQVINLQAYEVEKVEKKYMEVTSV